MENYGKLWKTMENLKAQSVIDTTRCKSGGSDTASLAKHRTVTRYLQTHKQIKINQDKPGLVKINQDRPR